MNLKTNISLFFGLLATIVLASTAFAQGNGNGNRGGSSTEYTFVTLDDRPGLPRSAVVDVVEIGGDWYCVGYLDDDNGDHAVMWEVSPSGSSYRVTPFELTDGEYAVGINKQGEIVGNAWTSSGLYWSSHTAHPLVLPPLDGDNQTYASAINVDGVIVGRSTHRYFDGTEWVQIETAVAWRAVIGQSGLEIRGPFALGSELGDARAVNDCDVAGVAQAIGFESSSGPVSWQLQCLANGDLAVLSGPDLLGTGFLQVFGINNNGDTCGRAWGLDPRQQYSQGFRQLADGTIEPLSTTRRASSRALDINDVGQVVGDVFSWEGQGAGGPQGQYGALWEADGKRVDLNEYLPRNTPWHRIWHGYAIDSEGTIAATGALDSSGNDTRALLMIKN